ncbi:MAG: M14 metallopeptidase family protein [Gemmatimonadales bacterium]
MHALRVARTRRLAAGFLLLMATAASGQQRPTSPLEHFGFNMGDDYHLATYTQFEAYWQRLDAQSDRMKLVSIGKTAEGRDQWMAIVTSPANHARLDHYRDVAARLARAEGLTDEAAQALAREGKAVIWIDGGLHANEVLGATQLIEHAWQMVSRDDPETMRILDDVIQLLVHANPDGMELMSTWYMRNPVPTERSTGALPRLYQKYVGHDNNRDFYLNAMPESENINRALYREWYPQIMYNHHQTGPAGTVMFAPPFREPHNHNLDPLLINSLSLVGAAMHTRFSAENKPGVTMREGANYQTWWNGGLRTTPYFHNMVGILTETIGHPNPMDIPLLPDRQISTGILPFPITPQRWHFRQSVDYSITANRAILDLASRYREQWLYNIYQMGREAIRKGSQDSWTIYPKRVERLREEAARARAAQGGPGGGGQVPASMMSVLRDPADRDPRGYILPADQPDFMTATRFVNALLKSGVDVHRATAAFTVAGRRYPAGSYVVKSAQAFRAHVLDMFEPQDYPNDFAYPGGPPRRPYDNAGYTLALQMGIAFDRILEGFDGPFEKITDLADAPLAPGRTIPGGAAWIISPAQNDAFVAVNRLLAARQTVRRLRDGRFHVSGGGARQILQALAAERGLTVETAGSAPAGSTALRPVRIGLWDTYGGSMPSGWTRWLFEQFEFPFELVFAQELDAGNLRQKFDVLVFVGGAIPAGDGGGGFGGGGPAPESIPAEFRSWLGRVTVASTIPKLDEFLRQGGTVLTIGSSTALAQHLGLPIGDHLVERTPDGTVASLPNDKFFVPTSVLEVAVDSTATVAAGIGSRALVTFNNNPVFTVSPSAVAAGVRPIAWFDSATPLRSGWAWGQTYLEGGVAVAEARVGSGTLYLFGPEITFRAQPHGTFRFLFNGILKGAEQR